MKCVICLTGVMSSRWIIWAVAFCAQTIGLVHASAQTTNISGIINRYTRAVLIDRCNSSIVVKNPIGFAAGDKVLIIQMKGAVINTSNTSSFGNITDYLSAGNYELATLDEVNAATLVLHNRLVRDYDVAGIVQVIRVPQYVNVTVTAMLTAKAWDGETGGVLALIASGTVTLNADVDVRGKGFRGGVPDPIIRTDQTAQADYYYGDQSPSGGAKGEAIVELAAAFRCGMGKLANGGGGGNSRAMGGGGGSNSGQGGKGGDQASYLSVATFGGKGGTSLTYSNSQEKVFLGGGGGSPGYEDTRHPVAGVAGGGIVLIRATALNGNGNVIDVSGEGNTAGDNNGTVIGGGGGGGGGVLLLDIPTYSSAITLRANGGKGSDTRDNNNLSCYGPGGGGGGGCIWGSVGSIPGNVAAHVDKGTGGIVQTGAPNPPYTCTGTHYGATDGDDGVVVTGLVIPAGTVLR
jgi:hypothetical protein